MMDLEIKTKWVAALRSGKYEQGVHNLKYQEASGGGFKYCCLGVLYEILERPSSVFGVGLFDNNGRIVWSFHSETPRWGAVSMLDPLTLQKVGLTETVAYFLAGLNDCGKTFAAIADNIEEKL